MLCFKFELIPIKIGFFIIFLSCSKIGTLNFKKYNREFDRNQLKLETQHMNMYMYQEKILK